METQRLPSPQLLEKIGRFPTSPGVYIMKDASSRILYIGKAVSLRARVRSYFGSSADSRVFHRLLVSRVADVDCIVAESEAEALILENNLIKKHRPVYNIRLKDDKTYVSIKVTMAEEWPRVVVVRRYKRDGNLYFGPYGNAGAVREMLRVIKTVFPLRTCSNAFFKGRKRPCIEHEIGRCTAPCVDLIDRERYLEDVKEAILFLKGRNQELSKALKSKMARAAAARQYELAGRYRDQIRAIERVFETQVAQDWGLEDLDVFATAREGDLIAVQEVLVREGRIVSSQCHSFRTSLESKEVLASFLAQYYIVERYIPPEILCSMDFPDKPLIEEWLREKRGLRVEISVPERGDKASLVELARKNAVNAFAVQRTSEERIEGLHASLQARLGVPRTPRRIECYDISNFQGSLAVGAMVTFEEGAPVKARYRKFRIQTVVGADDFRCMREVLARRLAKGKESSDLPDLILVDGGKGQLGVAVDLVAELGVSDRVSVAGIAKERRSRGTTERIFVPGRAQPLDLPQDSPESLYLQRIRDEAHRFAVSYHRELRKRTTLRTGLEGIPGIGKARRRALVERFGTLRSLRAASEADIAAVVGQELARRILEKLREPPA
ncbi:MAG: excinuclease ABC subunit UvrC [Planctomycetes bacterium]|nr:excinuclease ABC subunit UvrC [Planctomycetota bacterium]